MLRGLLKTGVKTIMNLLVSTSSNFACSYILGEVKMPKSMIK